MEKKLMLHTTFFWPKVAGFCFFIEILYQNFLLTDWRVWTAIAIYRIICVIRDKTSAK